MSGVEFHENEFDQLRAATTVRAPSKIIQLVLHTGIAKDERSANFVLLGVLAVCVLLMILVAFMSMGGDEVEPLPEPFACTNAFAYA